jgi:nucleotide-binding universal stress UspA family protein
MTGTIICTVDSSDGASTAIRVARQLAERFDARMVLVSVAGGPGDQTANRLAEANTGMDAEHRVAVGDPAESVAVIAAEEAAELIVVGARRGLLGGTLRSTLARDLAATAPCPVVVAAPHRTDARAARDAAVRFIPTG